MLLYKTEEFFVSEIITTFQDPEENQKNGLFGEKKQIYPALVLFFSNLIIRNLEQETTETTPLLPAPQKETNQQELFNSLSALSQEISKETSHSPLNFFNKLIDTIQSKIIRKFHKSEFRDDLNISYWQEQAKKIMEQKQNPESAREKILTMIREDLNHFTKEYLLNRAKAEFELEIPQDKITTSSYQQTSLKESVEKFAEIKGNQKEISRPEIESLVYGDFLNSWFQTAPAGQRLLLISPPGTKKEGYPGLDSYSFVFVYEIQPFSNPQDKKAKAQMYRQWLKPKQSLELLQKVANQEKHQDILEKENLDPKTIMLHPVIIDQSISNSEIEALMEEIYTKNTPQKDKEIKFAPENEELFWQEFQEITDQFFYPKIADIISKDEPTKTDWQIIEAALNFSQRAIIELREKYRIDVKVKKDLTPEQKARRKEENPLEKSWQIFYKSKIESQKITDQEKKNYVGLLEAAFANSGGFSGASQKVLSVGSCAMGTAPSLLIKGAQGMNLDIKKSILNQSILPPKLQRELNGKYICKICGEIISRPGFCHLCGKLEPSQYIKFKADNKIFQNNNSSKFNKTLFSSSQNKNKNGNSKPIPKRNSQISETVGNTFSNLIGGNSSSVSASSLLYSSY
jgi:hypothetical protein